MSKFSFIIVAILAGCAALSVSTAAQVRVINANVPGEGASKGKKAAAGKQDYSEALSVWRDPKFKRQFAQSYMAETEIEPIVTAEERDSMIQILELISTEKFNDALVLLKEKQTANSNAVFDFVAGNIHFQAERYKEATKEYRSAVDKYPKFRRAWKNLAMIFVRDSNFKEALPALTQVIQLGGADAVTYGLLGFSYANVEDDLAAESAFRMANLLAPETMDWKMGLARSFFKQGRFADAAALVKRLLEKSPERADLWMLLANAHLGLNQSMKAAEDLEIVKRLGGASSASLNLLGDIYVNKELFGLAVDSYLAAMNADKDKKPDRVIRAAKVLAARSALDDAARLIGEIDKSFGKTLAKEDQKDLLKIRARIAVAKGNGDDEVNVLHQIVDLDPLDGEALILLGKYYGRGEDKEKAIFFYERAANLEKFEADAKVYHAQILVGQRKYDEALPLLRRAQAIKERENIRKYIEQIERIAKKR